MVLGSKALNRVLLRWLTGNTAAMSLSVLESWLFGMKTPEMKYSGSIVACTIGWAESSLRMKLVSANDRQQKLAAPTMMPSRNAGIVELGRCTP